MKYLLILYIALGLVLSSAVGIEYVCNGQEMFPEYTGSPFIFRQKSLGSSLTHYYSIFGLIANIIVWTVVVLLFKVAIRKLMRQTGSNKTFQAASRVIVGILIVFTTLNIVACYVMLGRGFDEHSNYWYFNLDSDAIDWAVECEGKWGVFLSPE